MFQSSVAESALSAEWGVIVEERAPRLLFLLGGNGCSAHPFPDSKMSDKF